MLLRETLLLILNDARIEEQKETVSYDFSRALVKYQRETYALDPDYSGRRSRLQSDMDSLERL